MILQLHFLPHTLIAAFLLSSDAVAAVPAAGRDVVYGACTLALGPLHFLQHGVQCPKMVEQCQSQLRIKSLYLCMHLYGPDQWASPGLSRLNHTCSVTLNTTLPGRDVISGYSDNDIFGLRHLELKDRLEGVILEEVAVVSRALYVAAWETLVCLKVPCRYASS